MRRIHVRRRRVVLQHPGKLLYVAMLTALGSGACSSTITGDGPREGGPPARDPRNVPASVSALLPALPA
jgi:hypothetical protein